MGMALLSKNLKSNEDTTFEHLEPKNIMHSFYSSLR